MIYRSPHFDLGRDKTRIKDPRDAERQSRTVEVLLERLFHPNPSQRCEIQILADEVGMGKTFVALGVAYSVLHHLKEARTAADLDGCYQRVLVLTPSNDALFRKWQREVSEFARRCVLPEYGDTGICFEPAAVTRLDDLVAKLRRPGRQPQVVIARMSLFGGDKLKDYDLKRRFTLGVVFRHWGNRFNFEWRTRLLRGAPDDWPKRPESLTDLSEREEERLPFDEEQFLRMLENLDANGRTSLEALLEDCRELAQPYQRGRSEAFGDIERRLIEVYRTAALQSLRRAFPLLVVDEAHNWKNGPLLGSNGFREFSTEIAPHVRRALLLTATPFQLRPEEILEILKVSDFMQPCPTLEASRQRVEVLKTLREKVIRPVLQNSERHSRLFSRAWARLPRRVTTDTLAGLWQSPPLTAARAALATLAHGDGVIEDSRVRQTVDGALAGIDPDARQFLREALHLYAFNADLSRELGRMVIRHRRKADHRLFRVGAEYATEPAGCVVRPDRHLLHAAVGLDVRGEGELPLYLLMRCVSEMKKGHGRSSLGSDLTGCYSTLMESAEGRDINRCLEGATDGRRYLELLLDLVNRKHDPKHPKFEAVVRSAMTLWEAGEKVLIFCFRVNTAERLREVLAERIRRNLDERRRRCLGGEGALKSLRSRLTARDRDLILLGLDRVLWSIAWATGGGCPFAPQELVLEDEELLELSRLALLHNVDLTSARPDRVFLTRATEHLLARRFLKRPDADNRVRRLLRLVSDPTWILGPYGLHSDTGLDDGGDETTTFDERGCHTVYEAFGQPSKAEVEAVAAQLTATRQKARAAGQRPILDGYALAPSLWLGVSPAEAWSEPGAGQIGRILTTFHRHLWDLTEAGDGPSFHAATDGDGFDLASRIMVLQSLRRALLRDSVLLRLLPTRADREDSRWDELLVERFFARLPGQQESMADRLAVFLEDLQASSGQISDPSSARGALYEATRLRDQQFVALIKGGGGSRTQQTRDRVFTGFNTPLLPEILICTQVGQEGIDLHRHCRHVVHYDLAWNPAVLEQRTGRADRIGSKTFRERDAGGKGANVFLDVGVPFLAGTYDERMYEELRLRAQTFEVLTGGDFAADHAAGADDIRNPEGRPLDVALTPLPPAMVQDLKVNFAVWMDASERT